ncbi:MAG: alpha-2-macroglobulin [Treponema sp.]|nr:alpha-2-macroglobulin [Treponema sp.]
MKKVLSGKARPGCIALTLGAIGALVVVAILMDGKNQVAAPPPDERLVVSFTGGVIGTTESVRVFFTEAQDISKPLAQDAFFIHPRVEGQVSWETEYMLVFTPKISFRPDTRYTVKINPASFVNSTEVETPQPLSFEFATKGTLVDIRFDPLRMDDAKSAHISGTIVTESGMAKDKVERIIQSKDLKIAEWVHEDRTHRFTFQPIVRNRAEQNVTIRWNGAPIGSKEKGEEALVIPELKRFEVLDISQPENDRVQVTFSSPLDQNQDLRGFVSLSGADIHYSIAYNTVSIYGSVSFSPGSLLTIADLQDRYGETLYQPTVYTVSEKWELPEVRFAGQGVILPSSQGSTMAVETRNVSGVMVEAFAIYGEKMAQFLQVNNLNGQAELDRVGTPVWVKAFDFDWAETDKNRWIRRGLDMTALARTYPDGMFHIRLTFRNRHIHYECTAGHGDFSNLEFPSDALPPIPGTNRTFSEWNDEENDYPSADWNRYYTDPCHPAFYVSYSGHNITVGRNILISDLGLLAKGSSSGVWLVAANNLSTAAPLSGVELQFLNYQGRVIETRRTNTDGTAQVQLATAPAFLCAQSGSNRAYIRLNDSLTLATSHFDVSGEQANDGIKGLIYGERGVWRPGDTLYLTFLLADTKHTLPPDHPVIFELEDPQGRIVEHRTYTESMESFYPITVSTTENAPTGDWTARVRVGGAVFNKTLKIETIMPNRLKMTLDAGDKGYLDPAPTTMTLEAAWLHGAPAPSLKADVSVVFSDRETQFATYRDYTFKDASRSVPGERQVLFEGKLDKDSRAAFTVTLSPGTTVPGKLTARFMTRVFEPSGAFSSEQIAMDYAPYRWYVGLKLPPGDAVRNMLLTGTGHSADIVVLDAEGKPVAEPVELEAALYQMNWRWWWEKGGDDSADFTNALSRTPVMQETIHTAGGKAQWKFQVHYPAWGRYLIMVRDKQGGHAAGSIAYIDWPGWAGRAQDGPQGSAFSLNLSTEKQSYTMGELVAVSFPSNKSATALVVIEKAGEIIAEEWIPCTEGTTRYEFTANPGMTPNIYVHITLLQQHLQTANDLPLRLYGIIPVTINDPATCLQPRIIAPPAWEPSSSVSFMVTEAQNRAMTYTAVVIDEGLLGLTRYTMPNPHGTFYRKEASFLKSWDMYSAVMGAYSGKLETLLAIGGSDDALGNGGEGPKRFKPVVQYFGPYQLKPGETRTETFDLGEYVGAVRIMVVAASAQRDGPAYGVAEHSVQVKSDLMVLGTAPRTLSPKDEVVIPVSVFSYKEGTHRVQVDITLEGALHRAAGSASGKGTTLEVVFDKPGDKIVEFRAQAADFPGSAHIEIRATSPGLKDALNTVDLEVRSTALPITSVYTTLLAPGASWTETITLPGRPGSNTAMLECSRIPPLNLEHRLKYLMVYPHGCIEQTTSAVFPQLFLDKVLSLDADKLRALREHVAAGIDRIGGFQTYNGGFSYWPGSGEAHEWGTTYAGHFLISAKQAGYPVPQSLLNQWVAFQRNKAVSWSGSGGQGDMLTQAYRLYTLALSGNPDLGSMNRLRERANLPAIAIWRLAAAYWYAGQRDAARRMIRSVSQSVTAYRELSGTFGSDFRDKAMILETLSIMGEAGQTKTLLADLAEGLSSGEWLSTQETAYALIAILPFLSDNKDAPITVEYAIGGVSRQLSFPSPVIQADLGALPEKTGRISIKNTAASPVYAQILARGIPEEGAEPAMASGLSLSVQYCTLSGSPIADPTKAALGDDLEVRVTVDNRSVLAVPEIALVHALPASWEILNTRLTAGSSTASSAIKYQDIRDDAIMTYFDLVRGERKTITFRVNNAYGGRYFMPAIQAYAMYDESIRAVIPGKRP